MMLSGELDAVMYYLVDPNLIDRSTADLRNHAESRFFPTRGPAVRYYQKTGLYPHRPWHGDQTRAGPAATC